MTTAVNKFGTVLWYDRKEGRGLVTSSDLTEYGVEGGSLENAVYLEAGDEVTFKPAVIGGVSCALQVNVLCTPESPCNFESCEECCLHSEHDHFICLDCGREGEPSDYYDEDSASDR